ncbi:MAG: hypothetical protein KA538_07960 [Azonexus sp.]|jgi:hypothetical protein|nr:hypothetical protein [Azonexus sp.]
MTDQGVRSRSLRQILVGILESIFARLPVADGGRAVCGLLLGTAIHGCVWATADGPDFYRVGSLPQASALFLREEPRLDARRVADLPGDAQCLRSLGCQGGLSFQEFNTLPQDAIQRREEENPRWCKLSYQGVTGWVEGRFLAEAGCSSAMPQAASAVKIDFGGAPGRRSVKGRIRGRQDVDYQFQGGAGQTLSVALMATNRQQYFNIIPPGVDEAMFIGNLSGGRFKRLLPVDGIYTVRTYLMRAAARRNESSKYSLHMELGGKPLAARPASADALVHGTPYHAVARIACADAPASTQLQCEAFVVRRGFDGAATLEVRRDLGSQRQIRRILFLKGLPVASDSTEPLSHVRKGDLTILRIGEQEYMEVPDALIFGG